MGFNPRAQVWTLYHVSNEKWKGSERALIFFATICPNLRALQSLNAVRHEILVARMIIFFIIKMPLGMEYWSQLPYSTFHPYGIWGMGL